LVIFVVLVVPIFLDGPPGDGEMISEPVLLPGQEGHDTKTVVLERGRSEPIPLANGTQQAADTKEVTLAEPAVEKPTPKPVEDEPPARIEQEPTEKPAVAAAQPAASTTGMWAVQLGSFSDKQNAEKLAADLRKQGYAAFLSQLRTSSGPLHRVRIGPQKDRESAEAMAVRLLKVGHKGQVLPHP
jgi:DedD protein